MCYRKWAAVFVSLALWGCSAEELPEEDSGPSLVIDYPPYITSVTPEDSNTGVSVGSGVVVEFSEPITPKSFWVNSTDTECSGSVKISPDNFTSCVQFAEEFAYANDNQRVDLSLALPLIHHSTYKVSVVGVADANEVLMGKEWVMQQGFTTEVLSSFIEDGAYTNEVTLSLRFAAHGAETAVAQHYVSLSDKRPSADSAWAEHQNSVSFDVSSGDGEKVVYVWFQDAAGNLSGVNSDSIVLDQTQPSGSFLINGGTYATSRDLSLQLTAADATSGVTHYRASESSEEPTLESGGWTSVSQTKAFSGTRTFPAESGDGEKVVYVWFRDAAGNIVSAGSDSIVLDETHPEGQLEINGGNNYTVSPEVSLALSATDATGVVAYFLSQSASTPNAGSDWMVLNKTSAFSESLSYTLPAGTGPKTLYVWYQDEAGNYSGRRQDTITVLPEGAYTEALWDTDYGLVVVQTQEEGVIRAYYGTYGFIKLSHVSGNTFEGYWVKSLSAVECEDTRDNERTGVASAYHGKMKVVSTTDGFTGFWGYCDETPEGTWNGSWGQAGQVQ